jgi:hypothetical protein
MSRFQPATRTHFAGAFGAASLSGYYRKDPDDGYRYEIEGSSVLVVRTPDGRRDVTPTPSQTAAILSEMSSMGKKISRSEAEGTSSGGSSGAGITSKAWFWPAVILTSTAAAAGAILFWPTKSTP